VIALDYEVQGYPISNKNGKWIDRDNRFVFDHLKAVAKYNMAGFQTIIEFWGFSAGCPV